MLEAQQNAVAIAGVGGGERGGEDISVSHLFLALRRRRRLVVLLVLGLVLLSGVVVAFVPRRYTAETEVTLDIKSEVSNVEDLAGGINGRDAQEIGSAINLLRAAGTARTIVQKLGLQNDVEFDPLAAPDVPPAEATPEAKLGTAVAIVQRRLDVTNDSRSYTLDITFTSEDPAKAARIANAFAQWFVDSRQAWRATQLDRVSKLLDEKASEVQQHVLQTEQAVADYRAQHGIIGTANDSTLNQDELAKAETELTTARTARATAEAALQASRQFAATKSREAAAQISGTAPNLVSLIDRRDELRSELAGLGKTYVDSHPTIVDLKTRLAATNEQLDTQINAVLGADEAKAEAAAATEAHLQARVDELTKTKQQDDQAASELHRLENERDSAHDLYQNMLQSAGRAGLYAGAQAYGAEITSPAVPPLGPSFPQTGLIMGLSVVIALLVATAVAIVVDALRSGFYTPEEVSSSFGLRVLGMVPFERLPRGSGAAISELALDDPLGDRAEALRSIGVALTTGARGEPRKVVMFSSTVPDEGKTSLVLSLGRLSAAAGKSVLAIEGDLRRPCFHEALPSDGPGMVEYLSGAAELEACISVDAKTGLRYISRGTAAPYPAELLVSQRLDQLIETARESFDLVLIDTPPVGVVSDALVIAPRADVAVVVLRHGTTDRRQFRIAVDRIAQARDESPGVVLSHVRMDELARYGSSYRMLPSVYR